MVRGRGGGQCNYCMGLGHVPGCFLAQQNRRCNNRSSSARLAQKQAPRAIPVSSIGFVLCDFICIYLAETGIAPDY